MTDTNTLAPCPFCGGAARRSTGGTGGNAWFGTGCGADQSCPAHLRALVHRTQAEADATWNRRAPAPAASEAQPVAVPAGMEPTNIEAVATVNTGEDGEAKLSWLIEGGLAAVPKGQTLFISSEALTDDEGCGEVFTATQVQAMGRVPPGWQADQIADYVADNWPMRKYDLAEIEQRLRMLAAAPSGPAREPLTDAQIDSFHGRYVRDPNITIGRFRSVVRFTERIHGIQAASY